MTTIRIEHPVPDFGTWKVAFESDPLHRKQSGVRRYRIFRAIDNPNFVTVDLEFDTSTEAQALLVGLQALWRRVEGKVVEGPRARILETVEIHEY
jgi:ribosomal protein L35AE/L33A